MTDLDTPTCETCRFFQEAKSEKHPCECRKHAPRGPFVYDSKGQFWIGTFPAVQPTDWCGEHSPKPIEAETGDPRPLNCRDRLREEGKAYPRSDCMACHCGLGGRCPYRLAKGDDHG